MVKLDSLFLKPAEEFQYLYLGNCATIPDINDKKLFNEVIEAMEILGIDSGVRLTIWTLLASILHLGNIEVGTRWDCC